MPISQKKLMSVIVCPGIHDPILTVGFVEQMQHEANKQWRSPLFNGCLSSHSGNLLIFPAQDYPAFSAVDILQFIQRSGCAIESPLIFICFSAGVVGAIGAAWGWQFLGGHVKALIAIDGWGVPLFGNFPIHRLSHDHFTHWSSSLLGSGEDSFYAEPPVEHLELWRSPQSVHGRWLHSDVENSLSSTHVTAAQFLIMLLELYF